jgi:pyridoxamine 5'-phosphate oxidase
MPGPFDQSDLAFSPGELLPEPLPAAPFALLRAWFEEAMTRRMQPNPNAMTLATLEADGRIGARVVLCKEIDSRQGAVVFYTNYASPKGEALQRHPYASVVFHWDHFDRQVRLEGPVVEVPAEESDAYFATRPWESRIGAWASEQSRPIGSRHELLAKVRETMVRFGLDPARPPEAGAVVNIPRPPHWGGFRLRADRVELWVSGPGRIHERALWQRDAAASGEVLWTAQRLQP